MADRTPHVLTCHAGGWRAGSVLMYNRNDVVQGLKMASWALETGQHLLQGLTWHL